MSDELIDRIVRGVLETLQSPAETVRSSNPPVTPTASPSPLPVPVPAPNSFSLQDPVITGPILEAAWNQQTQIRIGPKALLTPSARDFLKKRKIEVVRAGGAPAASSSISASITSTVRAEALATSRWRVFVVQTHPQLERILEDAARGTAAKLDRAVPGSVHEATVAALSDLSRAEIDGGILLTHQTLVAACRANRNPKIRAAAVRSVAELNESRRQLSPNLICLDPTAMSYFELRNIVRKSISGPAPKPPAHWNE